MKLAKNWKLGRLSPENRYAEMSVMPAFVPAIGGESVELPSPDTPKWSGDFLPPKRGEKVRVVANGIGLAKVVYYFVEHGWLGLIVMPLDPPAWYLKQNGHGAWCHVFGAECAKAGAQ